MPSLLKIALPMLTLLTVAPFAGADVLQDHPGYWLGDMKIPDGPTIKIGAELFRRADGSAWASIASPDQDAFDIPVTSITTAADSMQLHFSGTVSIKLSWVTDHFRADFQEQGGPLLSFDMSRVNAFPMPTRPQTPVAPFPYKEESLVIASTDGVTLGATLSVPNNTTHSTIVVLVHGSGPATRDELFMGHRRFAVLADYLARRGVAVLRYDKRGIGRSTGDYAQHTGVQLIDDLNAVVNSLKGRKDFRRLGLIGHSEGPGIAAAVAAQHPDSVDFLVSMAGVGLPGLDMMLLQDRATAIANGASVPEAERIVSYARRYYDIIISQEDVSARLSALNALEQARPTQDKSLAEKYRMNQGSLSLDWADKPFLRAILMADTTLDWRKVKCRVLALNGSVDAQVPVESMAGIVAALRAGGNQSVEAVEIPSLNHMFQTAKTGAEDEYGLIAETLSPIALKKIGDFVARQ